MSQEWVASARSSQADSQIRLLFLDEHPVFRMGLTGFLAREAELDVVGETSSSNEALNMLNSHEVDVLLVDFCFGTGRGAKFIRQVRELHPEVRIVVMTMFDEPDQLESAMKAGAHSVISKTQSPRRWVKLISEVAKPVQFLALAR